MNYSVFTLLAVLAAAGSYSQVVTSQDVNKVSAGYVFYAPTASESAHLLRNDGSIAHSWPGSGPAGLAVKLLADGSILRTGTVYNTTYFQGRGAGGLVEKRSWDGTLLWKYTLPSPEKYLQHHDVEALPNGNILMIAWELHSAEEALAAGRAPAAIPPDGIWSEVIFEVRPEPPTGGVIVWQWRVWDHLAQKDDAAGNARRFDINFTGSNPNVGSNADWLHLNSVSYNEKLDQIILSSRAWSEIWVIDHSTTIEEAASRQGGRYRRGGDILYRWGNPRAYGAGTPADQKLFNQHDAQWIASDLPGAGNILVFNNGIGRGYSSADELVPPMDLSGAYRLEENGQFGPVNPVWTFGATAGPNFITQTAGGTQRLRNGNTILCLSNANRVVEVTPEKEIVWTLNLGAGEAGGFTFRANRFPADAPQLAGTEFSGIAPTVRNAASMVQAVLAPGALAVASGTPGAVSVTDAGGVTRAAAITGSSPETVTFQVPSQTRIGPARLTVDGPGGARQTRDFRVNDVSPGLFSADGDGEGVGAVIATVDGPQGRVVQPAYVLDPATKTYVPSAIPFAGSVYLSLYGTGFAVSDSVREVTIGGFAVPILAIARLAELPGIEQINVGPLPAALAGKRNQQIVITAGGVASNAVEVSFQ